MTGAGQSRRQLIAGGLGVAAAAAGAPALATAKDATTANMPSNPAHDRRVLEKLLDTERLLHFAYQQAISYGKLGHASQEIVALLLDQEFAHTRALNARLASLPPAPSTRRSSTKRHPFPPAKVTGLFKQIKTETGALGAVVEIENLAESSYFMAIAQLHNPALITLATQILANEAQHWTLLVSLLHKGRPEAAVPHPSVRGSQHLRPLKTP
ncbi:MAG: ferritin-like domain-containing protein [Solirubrobacteraceae bacterium]